MKIIVTLNDLISLGGIIVIFIVTIIALIVECLIPYVREKIKLHKNKTSK